MGESFFSAADESQLLKQSNNNTVIPRPQWLPRTTGCHGLLRPSTRNSRVHTRLHGQARYAQPTEAHRLALSNTAARAAPSWRSSTAVKPHDLSLMILGLENSPYSTSLVRPRLKAAIANPSKCPVYHLQMHRSSSAQLLFTEAATPTRIEEHILLCTRCVPEYFAGASRLSEGRVRHACSVCEARRAWHRSRFAHAWRIL